MIFASFRYIFVKGASGDTRDTVLIDMDFRSLYQINPDHLVLLGYASLVGQRQDATGSSVSGGAEYACRLIGNFNETFNVDASIVVARTGDGIALFNGIAFSSQAPFLAPAGAQILMPATFQVEFQPSSQGQNISGDDITILCTIGYEIELKRRFNQVTLPPGLQ